MTTLKVIITILLLALWIRFVFFPILGWGRNSPYRGLSTTEGECEGEIAQVLRAGWQSGLITGWEMCGDFKNRPILKDITFRADATEQEREEFLDKLRSAGVEVRR